jgi:hypothetical protein
VWRLTLYFTLFFTTMGLWRSASAIAFPLRLAPLAASASPSDLPVRGLADLPTPQFFRFVLASDGLTLALEPWRVVSAETTRLEQTGNPSPPPAAPQTSQVHPAPLHRYLSGVETLLLRQTQSVGARQSD